MQNIGFKINKLIYFAIICIMIFVAGVGYDISPDWIAYFKVFSCIDYIKYKDIPFYSILYNMEIGYLVLNKIISSIGFDFGCLTILIAFFSLLLKSITFYRYSGYFFIALFLYAAPTYLFEEHIHIRQGLANALALFSVTYIFKRNIYKFLFFIFIGYLFHQSILIFIFSYYIYNINLKSSTIFYLVISAVIIYYLKLNSILIYIIDYIPFLSNKIQLYKDDILLSQDSLIVGDVAKIIICAIIILYNRLGVKDKYYICFRNIYICGVIMYFILGKGIFGIRLPGYYLVFISLLISRIVYLLAKTNLIGYKNFIFYSFIIYSSLLIVRFQFVQSDKTNFINYTTFFSNKKSKYGLWKKKYL